MQQVEVQPIGPQAFQAGLARALQAPAPGVLRIDLADQEDLLADPGQRLAQQALGLAFAVHLSGVDQGHSQFDAQPEGGHLLAALALAFAHTPSSLAQGGDGSSVREGDAADHAPFFAP